MRADINERHLCLRRRSQYVLLPQGQIHGETGPWRLSPSSAQPVSALDIATSSALDIATSSANVVNQLLY